MLIDKANCAMCNKIYNIDDMFQCECCKNFYCEDCSIHFELNDENEWDILCDDCYNFVNKLDKNKEVKKLEKHRDGLKESIREGNPFKVSNLFGIIVDLIDFVLELEKNKEI